MSDIDWPSGFPRTDRSDRERTRKFDSTIGETTKAIEQQMERMDVDSWRASTGSGGAHTKRNELPKASANPKDSGIVVYWTDGGDQYAVACDQWMRLVSNAREVLLWIEETRKRDGRPVVTGSASFSAAQLPSGDEDAIEAAPAPADILGVDPDAPDDVVEAAARRLAADAHPDQGGDAEEFKRIQRAKQALIGGQNDE